MSEATIRAAIYNAVNGVSDVGLVYDYERLVKDWSEFQSMFTTTINGTKQVRAWWVGYRGIIEVDGSRFKTPKRITRKHLFHIKGFMGIDDSEATEKTFAALAEDVCDALDSNVTLNGLGYVTPATTSVDPRPFSDVLVHGALIVVEVTEVV
jgi:hypothetical protein